MATNPTLLTMPIAENGQKNTIPATQAAAGDGLLSQSTGFPPETALPLGAGGKAPTREDFNGAFNLLSDIAFYAQKGWTFQYDATQDYFKGCLVIDPSDGLRYECLNDMVAGTVSPHEDTNNDYWKVFSTGGGVAVGFIMPYAGTGLQEGWLDCDGSAVSRTMYPDLFAAIGTTWGAGDGSTTFNLPRSEDLVLQGASALNPVGTYKTAGLPDIDGNISTVNVSAAPNGNMIIAETGAFSSEVGTSITTAYTTTQSGQSAVSKNVNFSAADSNSIYGASDTVQSPAACVRYMIKAFDGPTPSSAGIDLTQYAADLANKADRSLSNLNATGEDHFLERDFTNIYPNGGTESNPATVSANNRYVEANPFAGYRVFCVAEIFWNNSWGETGWMYATSTGGAYGTKASQHNDDSIVVQTGTLIPVGASNETGNPFGVNTNGPATPQCRVKVWKIGKVASA